MRLERLALLDFRNYARLDASFRPGLVILVGPNAQGKSNLLEAIALAVTGRSPRAVVESEVIRFGASRAVVRAHVARGGGTLVLEAAVGRAPEEIAPGRVQKELRVNGIRVSRSELLGRAFVVLASAADAEVASGSPSHRRRLLDVALSQLWPTYYDLLLRYARVLQQRNRILREGRIELVGWDEQLVAVGTAITERRREYVARLAPAAARRYDEISGGEALSVTYLPAWSGEDREAIEWAAWREIARLRPAEAARGMSLTGPHRDDLALEAGGVDLRLYGSRGQQRTAALALRLAEREVARVALEDEPVLLLDDALADLDARRSVYLLGQIGAEAQAFLTTTDLHGIQREALAGAQVFGVTAGAIEAVDAHLA